MTSTPGGGPQPPYDPNQPPPGYPRGDQPPPAPPGWYAAPPASRPPDHPDATKAMVLGLIGLVGGFTCFLPLALGPWAWVVGRRAVREIDAQPGRYEGRGSATAGYVMGVIATVLLVLGILAVLGLLALLVFAPGGSVSGGMTDGQPL